MTDLIVKHDISNEGIAGALEKCDWAGASIGNKATLQLAIQALRETRPAAPVEGLETVGEQYGHMHRFAGVLMWSSKETWMGVPYVQKRELVTRSNAEAIIAAKDAEWQVAANLGSEVNRNLAKRVNDLKADTAALTARVKALEGKLNTALAFSTNPTHALEALETQLAAVREAHKSIFGDKTMEGILWPDVKPTDLITIRVQKQIYDKARAALEAKP